MSKGELEQVQKDGETKLTQFVREAFERTQGKPTKEDSAAANEIVKLYRIDKERAKQVVSDVKSRWQKAHSPISERKPGEIFTNSLGMKFAWIPPGTFVMGSPEDEEERNEDETQHRVKLPKGFYMTVFAVTQEEWQSVMGNNPSFCKGEKNLPVETVSWDDCQEFIKKLRELDKKQYRLPSEREWEYACRAGTTTPFHFGNEISTDQANYLGQYVYRNGKEGAYLDKTTPVASFPANAWGLHDMHGNVSEWCQDKYEGYPQGDVIDPQEPDSNDLFLLRGESRVQRGGSHGSRPQECRSASRSKCEPYFRNYWIGFRICFCEDVPKAVTIPATFKQEDSDFPAAHFPKPSLPQTIPHEIITNSLGMKFAWIPPGKFMMGSPDGNFLRGCFKKEKDRLPNETQHQVTLTRGFYMGVYTVTQEEWLAVTGSNPSCFRKVMNRLPVRDVSWNDCQAFIVRLRRLENSKFPYRLPTEAEWEYACRSGTTTPFSFGETISTDQANYNGKHVYGNGKAGHNRDTSMPVGSFPVNAWGLHDMHGNVWEWCQDWYGEYPRNAVVDPQGLDGGEHCRVQRGGSWPDPPRICRSAFRLRLDPGYRGGTCGFRLCFSLE